jgi:hypothetical protein
MRHLRIYESFVREVEMDPVVMAEPNMETMSSDMENGSFEAESTDFVSTPEGQEGDYIVKFINPEGEEVTVTVGYAIDPEYMGKKMISAIEMIPDSSSDGRQYSFIGYYDEIPGSAGAYELKKVLIEG